MNIKNGEKTQRKRLGMRRCSLNRLSSSVQENGECVPTFQQSSVFKGWEGRGSRGPGERRDGGARAGRTLAFSAMSVGRGLGRPALQGVVLTGDVQVGVGLDLPALVTGKALEDS